MSDYRPRQLPAYMPAEIEARIEHGKLPWRERLVTPPPPGWPGGRLARALAWGRSHRPHRREVSDAEPGIGPVRR